MNPEANTDESSRRERPRTRGPVLVGVGVAVVLVAVTATLTRSGPPEATASPDAVAEVPRGEATPADLQEPGAERPMAVADTDRIHPDSAYVTPGGDDLPRRDPVPAAPRPEALNVTRAEMERLGLRVEIVDEGREVELPLESLFVLPGEERILSAGAEVGGGFRMLAWDGDIEPLGENRWRWRAPEEPGLYPLILTHRDTGIRARIQAFVLVPRSQMQGGRLNGYRIGSYPSRPLAGNPIYDPPEGFVEITEENQDVPVSPHFRLRHFPAKQGSAFPKYVVLRPELLRKLEWVIDALNDRGHDVSSLFVMSGYRTPFYNDQLGNVRYSRHQWGGAADIYVDERPRDGTMDDLNGDGRVNVRDARYLYAVVDSLEESSSGSVIPGGVGLYGPNHYRGPFVHVDVRGTPARW